LRVYTIDPVTSFLPYIDSESEEGDEDVKAASDVIDQPDGIADDESAAPDGQTEEQHTEEVMYACFAL